MGALMRYKGVYLGSGVAVAYFVLRLLGVHL